MMKASSNTYAIATEDTMAGFIAQGYHADPATNLPGDDTGPLGWIQMKDFHAIFGLSTLLKTRIAWGTFTRCRTPRHQCVR
jgi:hypothetical protein